MGINNPNKVKCSNCESQAFIEIRRSRYNVISGELIKVTFPRILCLKCHAIYETPYAPKALSQLNVIHIIDNRYPLPGLLMRQDLERMGDSGVWK